MKRGWLLLLVFLAVPGVTAVKQQYQAGKIVAIQQKARTRILYYLVNTPITEDDPYYEIGIQVRDKVYAAEYTPRHAHDELPDEWKPDADVEVRVEKWHLFVKRPSGIDMDLLVVKSTPAPSPHSGPEPENVK
jgi:hypothetical protein